MTNIHFPTDGPGTQALQKQNKQTDSSFQVDGISADLKDQKKQQQPPSHQPPTIETETDENQSATSTPRKKQARQSERRKQDRRQQSTPVVLDTRSAHDRRKNHGKRKEDQQNKLHSGIDTRA